VKPLPELPKLSAFTKLLAFPEEQFESMAKSAGVELPPGPQSTLLKIQMAMEEGRAPTPEEVLPKAPKLEEVLGKLPALSSIERLLPSAGGAGEATKGVVEQGATGSVASRPSTVYKGFVSEVV
jgi:hypothetical protein